jgi:hypothetical protein
MNQQVSTDTPIMCECIISTQYIDSLGICQDCASTCAKCNDPLSCTMCANDQTLVNGECLCNNSHYFNKAGICTSCSPECLTCFGSLSSQCLSCGADKFLLNGICQCLDILQFNDPTSGNCMGCSSNC